MKRDIEEKVNNSAGRVIPLAAEDGFKGLPLKDKLYGLKFFAEMSKEEDIIIFCKKEDKQI